MSGATYDTGMLIALDRRKSRALAIHERLFEKAVRITVPWVVVAEFWRGRTARRDAILRSVDIEPPSIELAKRAGEALASVAGATLVDTVVMTSAAVEETSSTRAISRIWRPCSDTSRASACSPSEPGIERQAVSPVLEAA